MVFSRRGAESPEESYAYDEIGNLLSLASPAVTNVYTANELNQYVSIAGGASPQGEPPLSGHASLRELSYDADGDMTADGAFSCVYDAANRLVSVSSNGVAIASFAYDAKSRRVRKVTPSASIRTSTTWTFPTF